MKLDIKSFYRDMKKSHEKGRPGFLLCGAFFLEEFLYTVKLQWTSSIPSFVRVVRPQILKTRTAAMFPTGGKWCLI